MTQNTIAKISFDFDNTLDIKRVQEYAKALIKRDFEVWICTSRQSSDKAPNKEWNDDLFQVAKHIGIKEEHIIFTNLQLKSEYIKVYDFLWHLDDDTIELDFINEETTCVGIERGRKNNWLLECDTVIMNFIDKELTKNNKNEEKT